MAQYLRVEMPRSSASDPMASLAELLRLSQGSKEMDLRQREQAMRDTEFANKQRDQAAVDAAQMPVPDTTAVMARTAQPATEQTLPSTQMAGFSAMPGATRAPTRPEVIASLQPHLRPVIQMFYDESDKNSREAQAAIRAAATETRAAQKAVAHDLAGLGYHVAQLNYAPEAVKEAISIARETYADSPQLLKQVDAFEQRATADPSHIKTYADGLWAQDEHYVGLMEKAGNKSVIDLSNDAINPDPAISGPAKQRLKILEEHQRASATPPKPTDFEAFQAAKPDEQKRILAGRRQWSVAGFKPDDPALLEDRRVARQDRLDARQDRDDMRKWSADRSVAARQYAAAVKLYAGDLQNNLKDASDPTRKAPPEPPEAMTQSFEDWQAAHPPKDTTTPTERTPLVVDRNTWDPRPDGTKKGEGFFGALVRPDGKVSSELSIADSEKMRDAKGKYLDYPTFVPTLTQPEIQTLLRVKEGDPIPQSIKDKAEAFALGRLKAGKPVFAQPGEQRLDLYPDLQRAKVVSGKGAAAPARGTAPGAPAAPARGAAPTEGTQGTVNGTPAVWKTVNGKAGWYAR